MISELRFFCNLKVCILNLDYTHDGVVYLTQSLLVDKMFCYYIKWAYVHSSGPVSLYLGTCTQTNSLITYTWYLGTRHQKTKNLIRIIHSVVYLLFIHLIKLFSFVPFTEHQQKLRACITNLKISDLSDIENMWAQLKGILNEEKS